MLKCAARRVVVAPVVRLRNFRVYSTVNDEIHPKAQRVLDWMFEGKTRPETFDMRIGQSWFGAGSVVDPVIREKFLDDVEQFGKGQYRKWKQTPHNNLAGILLADQFTRCVYRGTAKAFELDPLALEFAQYQLDTGMVQELDPVEKIFVFLPYEHSESIQHQQLACQLFSDLYNGLLDEYGAENELVKFISSSCDYAERHRRLIERFGRFPHRNSALGRSPTKEEIEAEKIGELDKFM